MKIYQMCMMRASESYAFSRTYTRCDDGTGSLRAETIASLLTQRCRVQSDQIMSSLASWFSLTTSNQQAARRFHNGQFNCGVGYGCRLKLVASHRSIVSGYVHCKQQLGKRDLCDGEIVTLKSRPQASVSVRRGLPHYVIRSNECETVHRIQYTMRQEAVDNSRQHVYRILTVRQAFIDNK